MAALVQRRNDEIAAQGEQHQHAGLADIQYRFADKKQIAGQPIEMAVTLHFCDQMGIGNAQRRNAAQGVESE